jgi:hypothetical protein
MAFSMGPKHVFFPGLDHDHPRIGYADGRDLIHRHGRTIVFHGNSVQKRGARAALFEYARNLFSGSPGFFSSAVRIPRKLHVNPLLCSLFDNGSDWYYLQ